MNQYSIFRVDRLPERDIVHHVSLVSGDSRSQVRQEFLAMTGWNSENVRVELFDLALSVYEFEIDAYLASKK